MGLKGKSLISFLTLVGFLALTLVACQPKKPAEEPATSEAVVQEQEEPTPPPAPVVEEAPAPVAEAPAPVVEAASGKTSHTVSKGECLWTISEGKDGYDDPFKWPLIYKANRDQIKDPDLIYPNQTFSIPRGSSSSEVDDAVHEAKTRGPWSLWDGK